jgi:hypothetical protein
VALSLAFQNKDLLSGMTNASVAEVPERGLERGKSQQKWQLQGKPCE